VKKEGRPLLALEAGNSLFADFMNQGPPERAKAEVIAKTLGKLGVKAMAVGMRDLSMGPELVSELGRKYKVEPLSANLVKGGKLIFAPSAVYTAGPLRIGVIGLSPANPFGRFPGVEGKPLVAAASAEAKKLKGKVDLIVVLAAVPYPDALEVANALGSQVDLILQTHDLRGTALPVAGKGSWVLNVGERGRVVSRIDLDLSGGGPLVDMGELKRLEQTQKGLEAQVKETRKRLDAAKGNPANQRSLAATLAQFEARQVEVAAKLQSGASQGARTFALTYANLGADVPSDEATLKEVAAVTTVPQ
jgi:2',3'-cyclic-nucleotide 2'-phosphodiesterase (5'-nucleotidase family)